MPVDDPRAVQIVGGELTADAIARQDANAEAPHLAGHMPEHDVVVIELHTEHGVGQSLDHLALEFDLVLLGHPHFPSARTGAIVVFRCSNYQRRGAGGAGVWMLRAPQGAAPPVLLTVGAPPRGRAGAGASLGGCAGALFSRVSLCVCDFG